MIKARWKRAGVTVSVGTGGKRHDSNLKGLRSAPIQGLGIRWGFSRYEAQQMSDPQFNALAGQVQAISAQIQTEQSARVAADEILASRVTAGEAAIAAVRLQLVADAGNESGEKILLERRLIEIERRLGIV